MRLKISLVALCVCIIALPITPLYGQEGIASEEMTEVVSEESGILSETLSGNVTLDFKEADIRNVLRILSYKGGVNIVAGKGVEGPVTIRLTDVPWEKALDVLLSTYDYGYERDGNIISVNPLETLTQKKLAERELAEVEPLITEVFNLKFLDANDAKKVLEHQLSSRGRITVLEIKSLKGWSFGTGAGSSGGSGGQSAAGFGKRERLEGEGRAKVVVVSDIASYMVKVKEILAQIDVMPKQVLIETRIMEVNKDVLRDIGFDWGTGSSGASSSTVTGIPLSKKSSGKEVATFGAHSLGSEVAPAIFGPEATGLGGTEPYNTGLELVFKKLTGAQFEVIVHALEEDVRTNTLSSPRIMTLDNQEAAILVGTKYPILEAQVSGSESTVTTSTLSYYEDIGIQLNVVPQVSAEKYINMIIHPVVSSYTTTLKTYSGSQTNPIAEYPIINTREAETQVLVRDGETVVIGGLLKDVKSKGKYSVPILGDIPILGLLFQRDTDDTEKIDLLVFMTARIVKPDMGEKYMYGLQDKMPTMSEVESRQLGYDENFKPIEKVAVKEPEEIEAVEVPKKE